VITNPEIIQFLEAAAELGVTQVHYSGGEPTLRRKLSEIMRAARTFGYSDQAITTNGAILYDRLAGYIEAGLTRANISIDSLSPTLFLQLTGRDELKSVLRSIDGALTVWGQIKLNIVVMKCNLHEIGQFLRWARQASGQIVCRFIELQTNQPVFYDPGPLSDEHVELEQILGAARELGSFHETSHDGKNPNCQYYEFDEFDTRFGVIANHSRGYPCGGCRKLRLSPYGDLGVCITAEGANVRHLDKNAMRDMIASQIKFRDELDILRPDRHHLSHDYGFWRWGDLNPQNESRPIAMRGK
jgi:cyclic pyranopterin phosphate synthase